MLKFKKARPQVSQNNLYIPTPNDLTKLSNVVKNDVVKNTEYNTLKNKVDAVDTSGFVTNTKFATDTNALDDKSFNY